MTVASWGGCGARAEGARILVLAVWSLGAALLFLGHSCRMGPVLSLHGSLLAALPLFVTAEYGRDFG